MLLAREVPFSDKEPRPLLTGCEEQYFTGFADVFFCVVVGALFFLCLIAYLKNVPRVVVASSDEEQHGAFWLVTLPT